MASRSAALWRGEWWILLIQRGDFLGSGDALFTGRSGAARFRSRIARWRLVTSACCANSDNQRGLA